MELEALSIVRNCIWSNLDRKRHNLINKRTRRRWRRRGSRLINFGRLPRRRHSSIVRQENPDAHLHYVLCGRCEYDACDVELRIDLDLYRARNPACRGIDDYEGLLLGEGQGP